MQEWAYWSETNFEEIKSTMVNNIVSLYWPTLPNARQLTKRIWSLFFNSFKVGYILYYIASVLKLNTTILTIHILHFLLKQDVAYIID